LSKNLFLLYHKNKVPLVFTTDVPKILCSTLTKQYAPTNLQNKERQEPKNITGVF